MTGRVTAHRWVVDGIEEGVARVEEDGATIRTVPLWMLPAGVAGGDVLRLRRAGGADAVTVTITRDQAGTAELMEQSRRQGRKIAKAAIKRDAGGNVAL